VSKVRRERRRRRRRERRRRRWDRRRRGGGGPEEQLRSVSNYPPTRELEGDSHSCGAPNIEAGSRRGERAGGAGPTRGGGAKTLTRGQRSAPLKLELNLHP